MKTQGKGTTEYGEVLRVEDFRLCFNGPSGPVHAVRDANLTVHAGEVVALVGESGSGKTALCRSILMLHAAHARYLSGRILLDGQDVLTLSEKEMLQVRGRKASVIFQSPLSSLNPVYRVGEQIAEAMGHRRRTGETDEKAKALLGEMGIENPSEILPKYPHQLSGGQGQRVALAIALAGNPSLLVADEPTTALDPATADMVTGLLRRIANRKNVGILFVTHDLGIAGRISDRVLVMRQGEIIEAGSKADIFENPQQEYTQRLVRYARYGKEGAHYHRRGSFSLGEPPVKEDDEAPVFPLIRVEHLTMKYPKTPHPVFTNFNLEIREGEILGLIGESGCGKSTLARILAGIQKPSGGQVRFEKSLRTQMIFQDSNNAFNERMRVREIVEEPLVIRKVDGEMRKRVFREVTEQVELSENLFTRHPYEISGGQRQRVAIARALASHPEFLIADEPISSLDIPVQAEIVHLLRRLRDERKLTILLIAHDIPMVEHVSDRMVKMR